MPEPGRYRKKKSSAWVSESCFPCLLTRRTFLWLFRLVLDATENAREEPTSLPSFEDQNPRADHLDEPDARCWPLNPEGWGKAPHPPRFMWNEAVNIGDWRGCVKRIRGAESIYYLPAPSIRFLRDEAGIRLCRSPSTDFNFPRISSRYTVLVVIFSIPAVSRTVNNCSVIIRHKIHLNGPTVLALWRFMAVQNSEQPTQNGKLTERSELNTEL